jgi:argininosuccinate lyase
MNAPQLAANLPKGARDRMREEPNEIFGKHILAPIFEFNCKFNFQPLLQAHRVWLIMMVEQQEIKKSDAQKILRALQIIEAKGPDAMRPFDRAVEYFYLHMERALVGLVEEGEAVVGNLNIGRTRPEPLSRIVVRDALLRTLDQVIDIRAALMKRAEEEADTVMPGYTHMQHAQPTTFGHYLVAVHDHLARDTKRLLAAIDTTIQCTLGCGAMSGTSAKADRERVRELLGFTSVCENTIDSVSASDHVMEAAAALASTMTVMGRLAQDLYIWSSQEFALIDVGDSFSSPSSLMPQKKNALVLEYVRSRTARTIGELTSVYAVQHNVGYMDTEEVEIEVYRPLFNAFELSDEALPTMAEVVRRVIPNRKLMRDRTAWGYSTVTFLAEEILRFSGLSYRSAHRVVARAVLLASEQGVDATGINAAIVDAAAKEMLGITIGMDDVAIARALDPHTFLEGHTVTGAVAPKETRRMIAARKGALARDMDRVASHRAAIESARKMVESSVAKLLAS